MAVGGGGGGPPVRLDPPVGLTWRMLGGVNAHVSLYCGNAHWGWGGENQNEFAPFLK